MARKSVTKVSALVLETSRRFTIIIQSIRSVEVESFPLRDCLGQELELDFPPHLQLPLEPGGVTRLLVQALDVRGHGVEGLHQDTEFLLRCGTCTVRKVALGYLLHGAHQVREGTAHPRRHVSADGNGAECNGHHGNQQPNALTPNQVGEKDRK
jgi:hypothetical protein